MILLAMVGCGSDSGPETDPGVTADSATDSSTPGDDTALTDCARAPWIEVGNGEQEHVTIADGTVVTMVHGPQGGWHVWVSFRAHGLGDIVSDRVSLTDVTAGNVLISDYTHSEALVGSSYSECSGDCYGKFAYLPADDPDTADVDESPPAYRSGHEFLLAVTATDLYDATLTASASVSVIADCDATDVDDYAACTGTTGEALSPRGTGAIDAD